MAKPMVAAPDRTDGGDGGHRGPTFSHLFYFYFIRQFLFYPILSFLLTFKANYLDKSFLELKAFPVERWP